jgi:replicative DNA helicase
MTSPYDCESIIIGSVLRFGRDAALAVLPQLTSDKFIHSFGGRLGGDDNRILWDAITNTVLVDRADPMLTSGALRNRIDESLIPLAEGYANEIMYKYQIDHADHETLRMYARQVHRSGIVWGVVRISSKLAKLSDAEAFQAYVNKIEDPEIWLAQVLATLHNEETGDERYKHIGEQTEDSVTRYEQQRSGEQTYLLPIGVPMLYDAGLLPAEGMVLVHGVSSGGKSTLVHNIFTLGAAIGLVQSGVGGCVAINSLEMDSHSVRGRMAASLAGFNTFTLATRPQDVKEDDYNRFLDYVRFVGKLPIWMDDTPHISIDSLQLRLAGVHLGPHGPIRKLTTDYLELFDDGGDTENVEQRLGHLAAKHFEIRRNYHTCVVAVSQSTYTNKTFVAGMMGARYSRALTHKPDTVLEVVNYAALKRSGTDYIVAPNLDEDHVWVLLQKYRGGPTDVRMGFGWEPEYTRLYDPSLLSPDAKVTVFDHLYEVRKLLAQHPTTKIIPIQDTPLADLGGDF